MPKLFYAILINSMTASTLNTVVWFAVTFWVYLQARSVIANSLLAGIFIVIVALSGFFLGSLVDRYRKKTAMQLSSIGSLICYVLALALYLATPSAEFAEVSSPRLWLFVVLILAGAIAGNLRGIALSTLITMLVAEDQRDRANGLVRSVNGAAFIVASMLSGFAIAFLGMAGMLIVAIVLTGAVLIHLQTLAFPEESHLSSDGQSQSIDLRGTIHTIQLVPGLFGLIFFHTFNNLLSGVFMALLDPYGLELVSVELWGTLFGVVSSGFIVGGLLVARFGLGIQPLRTLFLANVAIWIVCIFFTIQPLILLFTGGMFLFMCVVPVIEAAEQTILQKVIPLERQGRVFGFAQSVEQAATPITAFLIGPIAQFVFIPLMTTGAGVEWIGEWFGTGTDRGMALLFTITGVIGLIVTLLAMRSNAYRLLTMNSQVGVEEILV